MHRSLSRMALVATVASSAGWVTAQQPATPQVPPQSTTQSPTTPAQSAQGGRASAQNQAGVAGQAGVARDGQMAHGVSLNAFIAHKLKRGNEAEVELGQLASERARTDSVKQFAQMMVQSHQQMIQQLEQFDQGVGNMRRGAAGSTTGAQGGQRSPNQQPGDSDASNRDGSQRNQEANERPRGTDNTRNSDSNTDGQNRDSARPAAPGGSQASSSSGTGVSNSTPNAAAPQNPGRVDPGSAPIGQLQGGLNTERAGGMSGAVPHQLVALEDQACDNELQLTRQMLEKHEGDDFEMAYIGQQIIAHTCMLAKLQALKNAGPPELQQLVTQGEQVTRQHLDQAQKIAQSLKSDDKK